MKKVSWAGGLLRPWAPPSYQEVFDFDTLTLEGVVSVPSGIFMRFSGTGQCAFLEANRQQMVASLPCSVGTSGFCIPRRWCARVASCSNRIGTLRRAGVAFYGR